MKIGVPLLTVKSMLPVAPPLHKTFTCVFESVGNGEFVKVIVAVPVHPPAPVTVTE